MQSKKKRNNVSGIEVSMYVFKKLFLFFICNLVFKYFIYFMFSDSKILTFFIFK